MHLHMVNSFQELGKFRTNLGALKNKARYKVGNTELAKLATFSFRYSGRE